MADYDFRTLSPADFELLVRDLLEAEFGWTRLEAFGYGKDGGVDLRTIVDGSKIVVQCKHYAGSTYADLSTAARKEIAKLDLERPDRYLFATSQSLSRGQKDRLAGILSGWLRDSSDLLARHDLNAMLGRHPQVERRHFKLWLASTEILARIVHSGIWERSEALMEDVCDRVKLYVHNESYERASATLSKGHVVVLTGVPGVGKSTLAEMLLLSHWHEKWQVVSISSDVDEGWDTYRRDEKQIFCYDDFLGQTDITERRTKNEDTRLVRFMERIGGDPLKRLVMTTRSQVLRQARLVREPIGRADFPKRESVVELADYGGLARARILYNHLYFSAISRDVVKEYIASDRYWRVIEHPNFSPRTIEQVTKHSYPDGRALSVRIEAALDRPIDLWGTMFATALSDVARRIVLSLILFRIEGATPDDLRDLVQSPDPLAYRHALGALEGTFVQIGTHWLNNGPIVGYANPSVRDFVLAFLDEEPEYALQLVVSARNLHQLEPILGYAVSATDKGPRFPALRMAFKSKQQLIADRIEELLVPAPVADSVAARPVSTQEAANLSPAASMLPAASLLLPDRYISLVGVLVRQARGVLHRLDATQLKPLTEAALGIYRMGGPTDSDALRELVETWGGCIVGQDEIEQYLHFMNANMTALEGFLNFDLTTRHCVESALRSEIDNMPMNRNSEDDDGAWLSWVEDTARQVGVHWGLQSEIEHERTRQAEHYEEQRSNVMPTSGAGVGWAPRQSDGSDKVQIRGMFKQLS